MKIMIFCTFGFLPFILNAQEYIGYPINSVHFYKFPAENNYYHVKIDSSVITSSDTTHVFESHFRNTTIVGPCTFWTGPECDYMQDVSTVMGKSLKATSKRMDVVNALNDTLVFDLNIALNDSSLVFTNGVQQVWLNYTSTDTMTVFGLPDSARLFTWLNYDMGGTSIPGFHGELITFSKNHGMVEGFALDSFPYIAKKMNLIGIRNPAVGFDGLSLADIYNYQVGTIIEIQESHPVYPPMVSIYYHYEVLIRNDNPGSLAYYMMRIDSVPYSTGTGFAYNVDTAYISPIYSKTIFIDELSSWGYTYFGIGNYYLDNVVMGCDTSVAFHISGSECVANCPASPACFGNGDCGWGGAHTIEYNFVENFGMVYRYFWYAGTMPIVKASNITYIENDDIECGSMMAVPENFTTEQFLDVFPNPSNGTFSIHSHLVNGSIDGVQIYDMTGKLVLKEKNTQGSNQMQVCFPAITGIYQLCVQMASGQTIIKRIAIANN